MNSPLVDWLNANPGLVIAGAGLVIASLLVWLGGLLRRQLRALEQLTTKLAAPVTAAPPPSVDTRAAQAATESETTLLRVDTLAPAPAADVSRRLAGASSLLAGLDAEMGTLELTRRLAFLQAEASAVPGVNLAELSPMELAAHQQLQNQLRQFIAARHADGAVPEDPSAFVSEEIKRLEAVVGEIAGFVEEQLAIGRPLLEQHDARLSRELLVETRARAETAGAQLLEQERQLGNGFLNHDLTLVNGQVDLAPDLIRFCQLRKPESPLLAPDRPALCQFTNGEGPLHEKLSAHLETIKEQSQALLDQHREQSALVEQARQLAQEGNYERARQLLDQINPSFGDLDTSDVREQIEKWRQRLEEMQKKFDGLKARVEEPWPTPFAQPWRASRRERALRGEADTFRDALARFHADIPESGQTDFAREGRDLYKQLNTAVNDLVARIGALASGARAKGLTQLGLIVVAAALGASFSEEVAPFAIVLALAGIVFKLGHLAHLKLLARTTVDYALEANGKPVEDSESTFIYLNGRRVRPGNHVPPGTYELTLDATIYDPVVSMVRVRYGRRNKLGAITVRLNRETYVNSLGMKFVPVPGTTVLFGVWQTRVRDYEDFARASKTKWPAPRFKQYSEHPATNVSWDDARDFCRWLTDTERAAGRIGERDFYRLPSDLEWSAAVLLGPEKGKTPEERSAAANGHFPWGDHWPPPNECANLDPALRADQFDFTSPVGSFRPNRIGVYDLSGNVWEWCDDFFDGQQKNRVLRGGSWHTAKREMLTSGFRLADSPGHRVDIVGFRCVIEVRKPSPLISMRGK